jgi:serine/threonine protein kinase
MAKKIDPLIGITLGNYVIKKVVGKGAMGKVYLGVHPSIGKKIAVKVLASHLSTVESMSKRFMREAKTINKIEHPNIIEIYDFGVLPDRRYYYTMEYLKGDTLTKIIKKRSLNLKQIMEIMDEICDSLDAVHSYGIIHRDLKPSNIMLCKKGRKTIVKILDFGIAKLVDTGDETGVQTVAGAVLGTPVYMSPEQAMGKSSEVNHLADIYSVGVILYKLLSGELPVPGKSIGEVLTHHLMDKPKPLFEIVTEIPKELSDVVMKCLAKKPEDRFQNVYKFYEAVEAITKNLAQDMVFNSQTFENEATIDSSISQMGSAASGARSSNFVNDLAPKEIQENSDYLVNFNEKQAEPVVEIIEEQSQEGSLHDLPTPPPEEYVEEIPANNLEYADFSQPEYNENQDSYEAQSDFAPASDSVYPHEESQSLTGENYIPASSKKKFIIPASIAGGVVLLGIITFIFWNSGKKNSDEKPILKDKITAKKTDPTMKSVTDGMKGNNVIPPVMDISKPVVMKKDPVMKVVPVFHNVKFKSSPKGVVVVVKISGKSNKTITLPGALKVKDKTEINITANKKGYITQKIKKVVTAKETINISLQRKKTIYRPMKRRPMKKKTISMPDVL